MPAAINPGCINLIPNGDFEQFTPDWQIQSSNRPASYSNEQAFGGTQSMRMGNGLALPDIESISEVRHKPVLLPSDATSIILRFLYWPLVESTPGVSDLQQVDLFDAATGQLILPLLNVQDDKRDWKAVDYDLTAYAGREVSLRFRVRNDGTPGRTLMYVDSVELEYCAATPIPTYTPSPTLAATGGQSPALTATAIATSLTSIPAPTGSTPASATPTPTTPAVLTLLPPAYALLPTVDPTCPNILADPGFEGWGGWIFGEDPVPGRYVSDVRLAGATALLLGNPPGQQSDVVSFSSVRQLVTIPADVTRAELRWWKYLRTEQPGRATARSDRQDVVFLDSALNTLAVARRELSNEGVWQEDYIDLSYYRGQTFYVYFNAFNDGNGQRTWLYLDNVQLNICGSVLAHSRAGRAFASTPIAIPLTPLATHTRAPLPTPSPLPTALTASPAVQLPLPTATSTVVPAAAAGIVADSTATLTPSPRPLTPTATVDITLNLSPTSNVYALPTATASFLVETPASLAAPPDSGITVVSPAATPAEPTAVVTRSIWIERLGPISVLLGVLVLIGFIVWAILRTFRTSRG